MAEKKTGAWQAVRGLTGKFKKIFKKTGEFSYYKPPGGVKDGNVGALIEAAQQGGHDSLDLSKVELSERGLAKLKEMRGLRALKLTLSKCRDEDLMGLAGLDDLEWLDLSRMRINGACFTKLGPFPSLEYLNLSQTKFVDGAVPSLKKHPKLGVLDLSHTHVTSAAVDVLQGIPTLRVCKLQGSQVDMAALASIGKSDVEWDM